MIRIFCVLAGILLMAGPVLGNFPPEVTNVVATQRAHTALIDVTYDIVDIDGDAVHVSLWFSVDGGVSWDQECVTVSGDVGPGVVPSAGLTATWDAGVDFPDYINNQFSIRVYADDGNSVELSFPGSPGVLMANFQTIYETMDSEEYGNIMHPDFLTILQQATIDEFPDVGTTLDVNEELRIHDRLFSGEAVTDPNGDLVPGVTNISFSRFIALDTWHVSPPEDIIPNAEWAPYDVEFLFDRGQTFSTLKVEGTIKFYVTSRDSMHEGSLRQFYQMIGQVDLTSGGGKAVENLLWGSAKAIFR